jgi:hypothetical protein
MCTVKCIFGEQRLPLGGSRHCLFIECCTNGLLPDIISHGQYTPYMVWIVGRGGVTIRAHHPWEVDTPLRGLELSPLGS